MSGAAGRGSLAGELARKGVHVAMGGFAFVLRYLTWWQAAIFAVVALAFNLGVLHRLTGGLLLRQGEKSRGFSWGIALYPAVVLAAVIVFHDRLELAAATWALLAFGDGMATVAGKLLRGPELPWNPAKSWAGLVAFVLYGTAGAAAVIPWTQRAVLTGNRAASDVGGSFLDVGDGGVAFGLLVGGCFVAALAAALAESAETGIDDNILVPLVGGAALYVATLVEPARIAAAADTLGTQFAIGAAVNAVLGALAYAARGVDRSGAFWGWVLGTTLYGLGGFAAFAPLLGFFVLGTAATKTGYARKAALGIAQEKGGRRGARNAFANVGAGVLFAACAVATAYPEAFWIAVCAAFATAAADTVSSEIGQAFGRTHVLITSLRRVPAGTDGAVSIEGTVAGIAGGAAIAAIGWAAGLIGLVGVLIVTVAAFVGNTLESYVGAAFDGVREIDNELVNFANTVAGGGVALALVLLWDAWSGGAAGDTASIASAIVAWLPR